MPTSISTRTPGSLNPTRQQLDELDALLKRMLELPVSQLAEKNEAEAEAEDVADEPPPPATRPRATQPAVSSVSYTVVETATPRPLPPASGFEPRRPPLVAPENAAEKEMETPPSAAVPMAAAEVPASEAEAWVPLRSTWQPSAQTWQPLAESWRQANSAAAAPAAMPKPTPSPRLDPAPPAAMPPAPQPIETMTAEPAADPLQTMTDETPVPPDAPPSVATDSPEPRLSLTAEDAPAPEPRLLLPLLWFNQGFDACVTPLGAFGRWLCGPNGRQMLGIAGLACLVAAVAVAVSTGMAWSW